MVTAIKVVFLAIFLVAAFLPLGGVDGLTCYRCSEDNYASHCYEPNPNKTKTCKGTTCVKAYPKENEVRRGCDSKSQTDGCNVQVTIGDDNGKNATNTRTGCACNKDLCNSVGYLQGCSLVVFGLIPLAVVSNLGRQYLN